jgi:hypothetical protein
MMSLWQFERAAHVRRRKMSKQQRCNNLINNLMQDYELAIEICLREYIMGKLIFVPSLDTEIILRCRLVSRFVNHAYTELYKPLIDKELVKILPHHRPDHFAELTFLRLCEPALLHQYRCVFDGFQYDERIGLALYMEKVVYPAKGMKELSDYHYLQRAKQSANEIVCNMKIVALYPSLVALGDVLWMMQELLDIDSRIQYAINRLTEEYVIYHLSDVTKPKLRDRMRRHEKLPCIESFLLPFMAYQIMTEPLMRLISEKNLLYQVMRRYPDEFETRICLFISDNIHEPGEIYRLIYTMAHSFTSLLPKTISMLYSEIFFSFTGNVDALAPVLAYATELRKDYKTEIDWHRLRVLITTRLSNDWDYLIDILSHPSIIALFKDMNGWFIVPLLSKLLDATPMSTPTFMKYVRLLIEFVTHVDCLTSKELQRHMMSMVPDEFILNLRHFVAKEQEKQKWFKQLRPMVMTYIETMSFEENQLAEMLTLTKSFNLRLHAKPIEVDFYLKLFRATKKRKCHHCQGPLLKCINHMRELFRAYLGVEFEFDRVWQKKCARMIRQRVRRTEERNLLKKTLAMPVIIYSDDDIYDDDDGELGHFSSSGDF